MTGLGILQDHQENYDMDNELIIEINKFIKTKKIDCYSVRESSSKTMLEDLASIFSFDLSNKYLWEDAYIKEKIAYTDSSEWEVSLSALLKKFSERIYLVVTDDNFYPWTIFDCEVESIIYILKEQQYFEFFVFDESMKYILFDTHANELLLASSRT